MPVRSPMPLAPTAPVPILRPHRRFLDVALASVALGAALPVLAVAAVAIRAEGPGPLLYRQARLGRGGRTFVLYKLRKFRADVGDEGLPVTLAHDPRLTRVGRLLEQTKLDELPQLWNVLKGDLALVGPRPESLRFADLFTGESAQLLQFRPGLFGPSQFHHLDEASLYPPGEDPQAYYRRVLFPAKAAMDLAYYPTATLAGDLGWVVRCVGAVLRRGLQGRQSGPTGQEPKRTQPEAR